MMWARKIRGFLDIPADFASGGFPEAWSGPTDHTGPDGDTPLKEALIDKTQAGLYTLYSGILIWAAARLEEKTDVGPLEDLSVALFCLQQDNSYYLPPKQRPNIIQIEEAQKYTSTLLYLVHLFFQDRMRNEGRWPLHPNFVAVAKAINLTRHHMFAPQRALFDPWVEGAIKRMDVLAPFPEHAKLSQRTPDREQHDLRLATLGRPIPPQVLDLSVNVDELNFEDAWREFLTSVDWAGNRYLNPPAAVILAPGHGRAYAKPR